jgi:hypothetical protein
MSHDVCLRDGSGDRTALPVKPLLQTTCGYAGTGVMPDADASSALLHFDIVPQNQLDRLRQDFSIYS